MSAINAIIWGAIQGITEFIPVSSSGHLVVVPRLLGIEAPDLFFNVALHIGTLAAVILFFYGDITILFLAKKREAALVVLACVPIIAAGLLFADTIKPLFERPLLAGWMFFINGGILLLGHARLIAKDAGHEGFGIKHALLMGIAQIFALMPGISRSGITIVAGVQTGLRRREAYRYAFLMFIPTAIMALIYSLREASNAHYVFGANIVLGMISGALFGIAALKLLYSIISKARLHILGFYCIALGCLTLYIFR